MARPVMDEFKECPTCAAKPGMPRLCDSCLHNREIISRLSGQMRTLASALKKFAPDLMDELVKRHAAAKLLDDLGILWRGQ